MTVDTLTHWYKEGPHYFLSDDTELRASTLALCREVAQADAHLSDAEESLLAQTAQLWGLGTDRYLQPPPQRPMAMTL